jgi:hypothetical protein
VEGDGAQQWLHENGAIIVSFAPNGHWTKEDGWVSHCYGERVPAPVCVFSSLAEGEFEVITFLLPAVGRVREVDVSGGRGFEVETENYRDLFVLKTAAEARTPSLISDFEYTWLRFRRNKTAPTELLLLGGQKFEFEGLKVADLSERTEYLFLPKA